MSARGGLAGARVALLVLGLAACYPSPQPAAPTAEAFDMVIVGGSVVDGTGRPASRADVGIRAGRIARIGALDGMVATVRIDATDRVVAPGFIDPHAHAIGGLDDIPTADNYLLQGITTVVDGNDGSSPLPIAPFLARMAAHRVSVNLALFIGHGTVRRTVMGTANRAPTPEELERMRALVAAAMDEGALGLSTGLAYVPGQYASTEEVVELARVARRAGGIYISHMRDEGAGVLASVRETIRIAEEAGTPAQISHHKVGGPRQFGQSVESLRLIGEARARGADITFDQYPYTASSTGLGFIIPAWAQADGLLEQRLQDDADAPRIRAGMLAFLEERFAGDAARIQLVQCRFEPAHAGRTLADLLAARGTPATPANTVELILELQRRGGCGAIFHAYDEGDVRTLLGSEYGMIGSDGSLPTPGEGSPHPRAYGTYPRVLGRYVREQRVLPLEEAVRKMTSFPARRLGFHERGEVREGWIADLVVFDPATIIDRATFEDPHQYPVGVEHVFVGGEPVIRDGRHTGARPGRILTRPTDPQRNLREPAGTRRMIRLRVVRGAFRASGRRGQRR